MIEPYTITQEDPDITQTDTTAGSSTDLFVYRVPKGVAILLDPSDVLALDLDETDGTVAQNTDEVKLEIRDSAKQGKETILGPILYSSFAASGIGEWADEDKLVHLAISRPIRVESQEYIALMVKGTAIIDKDLSAMSLRTHRERG
jgi:hypothetical protein